LIRAKSAKNGVTSALLVDGNNYQNRIGQREQGAEH
jgi:hypothetical protein